MTTEFPGTKVISDPVHKAKVGFVPEDQNFSFEDKAGTDSMYSKEDSDNNFETDILSKKENKNRARWSTLRFLETLGNLSDDELDKIHIPLKTIVRLLTR
jgi:hypothetical protein